VISILVVDDHQMFAEALGMMLSTEDDLEVLGYLSDAEDVVAYAAATSPDIVLMDIDLPGTDGVTATRRVVGACPATKVVLITALSDPSLVLRGIEAGASAFVAKERAAEDLVEVIRRTWMGEEVFPPDALRALAEAGNGNGNGAGGELTRRELEVLQGLADGLSTEELSTALFVSPRTVQGHVQSILTKLHVRSKLEAVIAGLRRGLIRLRPSQPPGSAAGAGRHHVK
jgi:two-component system, NarL family, response regulator LiaR